MAEHYGVKPKMFTKEWFPYYWMYYKWHTIAALFIAVAVGMGVSDCIKKVEPDLGVVYAGDAIVEDTAWQSLGTALDTEINDIDGDGKSYTFIMPYNFMDGAEYAEMNYAMTVKHDMSFTEETTYVYIYEQEKVTSLIENKTISETFGDTSKWLKTDVGEDKLVYDGDKAYAVSLKDSKLLSDVGINGDGLYILVKNDTDSPYANEQAFDNAVIAVNTILK